MMMGLRLKRGGKYKGELWRVVALVAGVNGDDDADELLIISPVMPWYLYYFLYTHKIQMDF